jgi:hypothetical protein
MAQIPMGFTPGNPSFYQSLSLRAHSSSRAARDLQTMRTALTIFVFLAFTGPALADDSCRGLRGLPKQWANHDLRLDLTRDCFCPDGSDVCLAHLDEFIMMCDLNYHCIRRYQADYKKAVRRAAYCRINVCAKEIPIR